MIKEWRARRALRARAAAYVSALFGEPPDEDVRWLATHAAGGDIDHARWELRYAKRALGLLTAQRDALDDRTGSAVAAALGIALARDAAIAPGRLRIAERQLNARLRAYGEALVSREGAGTGWHLGRALLDFAGSRGGNSPETVAAAADILARYLAVANEGLREHFGAPRLAEVPVNATGY